MERGPINAGDDAAVAVRRRPGSPALTYVAGMLATAVLLLGALPARADAACTAGSLYTVAHADDSLLFQSPDLLHDIQGGGCVQTIVVTAGDDSREEDYWASRDLGAQAAYAEMAGVPDHWTETSVQAAGHRIVRRTLDGTHLSIDYLRLPDGGYPDGLGTATYDWESLRKLWTDQIDSITAVDGSATYTRDGLVATLASLIGDAAPQRIGTQDFVGSFDDGDHADHHAIAYFTREAQASYTTSHTLISYADYATADMPANVSGADLQAKSDAFYAYTPFDDTICQTPQQCAGQPAGAWLRRQYRLSEETWPRPAGTNLARTATVSASSENASTDQQASKAVDGVAEGYPGDFTREWATNGGRSGSWLRLDWPQAVTIDRVVLHDRPNTDDRITSGALTFSDGSTVQVGSLDDDGSAVTIEFAARATSSVLLTVTGVSAATHNVGLSEIEVLSAATGDPGDNHAPTADAGPDRTVAPGETVALDGSGSSDPDDDPLSYTWTQTSGPDVDLAGDESAHPSFVAPSGPATLGFTLRVHDAQATSDADTVTVHVENSPDTNVASAATVTASSQNSSTGQLATKAVDGVADGYPGDHTREWATNGGRAGSWLQLAWTTPRTVHRVVLRDRPNLDDQATSGTLTFSDGSTVSVGALPNDGAPLTVDVPARATTSVRYTITGVSSTTYNAGLSEIEAWATG